MVDFCFFFFSSRRRHTRSDRDWSSDVCSSDLVKCTMLWCYTSSGEDSALVHCRREDSAPVHCSGEDSALVHCSGEDSAPVHCRREDSVLWCTSSGVDSAPLQMEWKADTPMFFQLEELVEGIVLCYYSEEDSTSVHCS